MIIMMIIIPCKKLNSSIRPIDSTQAGIIISDQSGHYSNGNEGVHHIPQSSRTETSPSDIV